MQCMLFGSLAINIEVCVSSVTHSRNPYTALHIRRTQIIKSGTTQMPIEVVYFASCVKRSIIFVKSELERWPKGGEKY